MWCFQVGHTSGFPFRGGRAIPAPESLLAVVPGYPPHGGRHRRIGRKPSAKRPIELKRYSFSVWRACFDKFRETFGESVLVGCFGKLFRCFCWSAALFGWVWVIWGSFLFYFPLFWCLVGALGALCRGVAGGVFSARCAWSVFWSPGAVCPVCVLLALLLLKEPS